MSATAFQMRRREAEIKTEEVQDKEVYQPKEMTVKQIKEELKEKGIEFSNRANKDELVKLLNLVPAEIKTEEV